MLDFYLPVAGMAAPIYLLWRTALWLTPHVPDGVHTLGSCLVVLGFLLYGIAVAIAYAIVVERYHRWLDKKVY